MVFQYKVIAFDVRDAHRLFNTRPFHFFLCNRMTFQCIIILLGGRVVYVLYLDVITTD